MVVAVHDGQYRVVDDESNGDRHDVDPVSSFANGTAHVVARPSTGASQTSTITTSRGGTYNTDISGLHLYAPISHNVQTTPTPSSWQQTFTWAGAESAFIG